MNNSDLAMHIHKRLMFKVDFLFPHVRANGYSEKQHAEWGYTKVCL